MVMKLVRNGMSEWIWGRCLWKVIGLMAVGKVHLVFWAQQIVMNILILPNCIMVCDEGSEVGGD
jgi:hypothetical protein